MVCKCLKRRRSGKAVHVLLYYRYHLLCVLGAHGLTGSSIKDHGSTFGAFERYVREREVGMVSEDICLDFIESKNGTRPADLYGDPSDSSASRRIKVLQIHLVIGKTGQPIDIPLLEPVGWSIIDYLKDGRPAVSHDHVFVRHRAPFGPLGGSGLSTALRRYIIKAGIDTKGRGHHGLHSLRSTAGNMLTSGAPLPVLSQTLGHQDIKTTAIYLKIDVEYLRRCALDPDAYRDLVTEGGVCDA